MQTITMIDPPTTWHDQRPTHGNRPEYVIAADLAQRAAYRHADELLEEHDASPWSVSLDQVLDAQAQATAAHQYYQDTYAAWQNGEAAGCTCSPVGDTCPDCRARIAAGVGVFAF